MLLSPNFQPCYNSVKSMNSKVIQPCYNRVMSMNSKVITINPRLQ